MMATQHITTHNMCRDVLGNIMMGKVKYNPKHKASLTKTDDQLAAIFKVMGAAVLSPKARYPAQPKTRLWKNRINELVRPSSAYHQYSR